MPDALVEVDGHVMTVTMNRPDRYNAMTLHMFARMSDAWQRASDDDDIRVIVLTGAGGNFSSGADLRAMAGDVAATDDMDVESRMAEDPGFIFRGLLKTYRPTKPIIAAVEGNAIAGGTEILQGTDIRVAGESAKFGVSEARWSLYPMGGSAVRLARQIPYTVAADILLTGKHIPAADARRHMGSEPGRRRAGARASERSGDRLTHVRVKFGVRFSANARGPSFASFDAMIELV